MTHITKNLSAGLKGHVFVHLRQMNKKVEDLESWQRPEISAKGRGRARACVCETLWGDAFVSFWASAAFGKTYQCHKNWWKRLEGKKRSYHSKLGYLTCWKFIIHTGFISYVFRQRIAETVGFRAHPYMHIDICSSPQSNFTHQGFPGLFWAFIKTYRVLFTRKYGELSILIHQINLLILCCSSDQWSLLMLKVNLAYKIWVLLQTHTCSSDWIFNYRLCYGCLSWRDAAYEGKPVHRHSIQPSPTQKYHSQRSKMNTQGHKKRKRKTERNTL